MVCEKADGGSCLRARTVMADCMCLVRPVPAVLLPVTLPRVVDAPARVGALEASLGAGARQTALLVPAVPPAVVVPVALPARGDAAVRADAVEQVFTTPTACATTHKHSLIG